MAFSKTEINSMWSEVKRYYAINHNVFSMEAHCHDEWELMYVANGTCRVLCLEPNGKEKTFVLKEQEYIVVQKDVFHALAIARDQPCRVLNLEIAWVENENFSVDRLNSSAVRQLVVKQQDFWKGKDKEGQLHQIIISLQKELGNPTDKNENGIGVNLWLSQLLLELTRQYRELAGQKITGDTYYIRKADKYLQEHFDQPILVEEIAEEVGLSKAYLQRLFKKEVGQTIIEKICQLRMEKAKFLLASSNLPVVDVAVDVGYNNRQHFSYVFSREIGCSPGVYRTRKENKSIWPQCRTTL